MKTAIAVRHVAFEDLGSLHRQLEMRGYRIEYREAGVDRLDSPALEQVDLLVVLGGPIGAGDEALYPFLAQELLLLKHRLQQRRPTLGICLGAQLMARALGARVAPMAAKEIGYAPLRLNDFGRQSALAPLDGAAVLHWHGDQFAIPKGAQCLAGSDRCPHQAFAVDHYALGLQFHLEAEPSQLERWLIGHSGELAAAGIDPRALREQNRRHGEALQALAAQVFTRWLNAAGA
ncbi:glutamine amidotransferase [Chromobacterium phragmitis]|uniref:Glutamine amidotransferase n=1 Tax=Chromobacterium phragmitis TaxID=2202141 RepID=A0A344UGS7_9NEIS|nr:glutamine amidotransferase [Chromobacterium phragmitis]AXE29115.1 glutamine amidotransferase [Chromobacterium phragmitis]AXE34475.1 glutamine amidotransferase [Chromobacterium phragmitis]